MTTTLDSKVPPDRCPRSGQASVSVKLVNPANKRKFKIIMSGPASPAPPPRQAWRTRLRRRGLHLHDSPAGLTPSPRKAGSTPPRIIATMAIRSTGSSMTPSREVTTGPGRQTSIDLPSSLNIIDQAVAQGVPFAREYGGLLDNRSFGGAQFSDLLCAGQTGQQFCSAPTRR